MDSKTSNERKPDLPSTSGRRSVLALMDHIVHQQRPACSLNLSHNTSPSISSGRENVTDSDCREESLSKFDASPLSETTMYLNDLPNSSELIRRIAKPLALLFAQDGVDFDMKIVILQMLSQVASDIPIATTLASAGMITAVYQTMKELVSVNHFTVDGIYTGQKCTELLYHCLRFLIELSSKALVIQKSIDIENNGGLVQLLIRMCHPVFCFLTSDASSQATRKFFFAQKTEKFEATVELLCNKSASFWTQRALHTTVPNANFSPLVFSGELYLQDHSIYGRQPSDKETLWQTTAFMDYYVPSSNYTAVSFGSDEERLLLTANPCNLQCRIVGVVNPSLFWICFEERLQWVLSSVKKIILSDDGNLSAPTVAPVVSDIVVFQTSLVKEEYSLQKQSAIVGSDYVRCLVVRKIDADRVMLLSIDYGFTVVAAWRNIYKASPELSTIPPAISLLVLKDFVAAPCGELLTMCLGVLQNTIKMNSNNCQNVCKFGGAQLLIKLLKSRPSLVNPVLKVLLNLSGSLQHRVYLSDRHGLVQILLNVAGAEGSFDDEQRLLMIAQCLSNICFDCFSTRKRFKECKVIVF